MQEGLEKVGAVVLLVPLPDEQHNVALRVRYHFDWQTIQGISQVLGKVQQAKGAQLHKDSKDHHQRNYSVGILQQERGSSNELER